MNGEFSLEGRVALVTGGGTGIGRGSALVLARYGADLVLAGRRPEPLEQTAAEIQALGRRALALPTDVTETGQCERLVETTLAELGRLDVLVNNAGGAETKPILKWTEEEWRSTLALNLDAVWILSRLAARPMLEQGKGSIVNISSGASLLAMPQAAVYGRGQGRRQQPHRLHGRRLDPQGRPGQLHRLRCGARRHPGGRDGAHRGAPGSHRAEQRHGAARRAPRRSAWASSSSPRTPPASARARPSTCTAAPVPRASDRTRHS